MIDQQNLFSVLKLNGLTQSSSPVDIERTFDALNYSEEDKTEARAFLTSQGWMSATVTMSPPPTQSATAVGPSPSIQLTSPVFSGADYLPKKPHHFVLIALVLALLILISGGLAYAYVQKIGPFAGSVDYTENNLLLGVLSKASQIDSASYALSGALNVGKRDVGAKPFTLQVSNEADTREKYKNDSLRAATAYKVLTALSDYYGAAPSNNPRYKKISVTYPATLKILLANIKTGSAADSAAYFSKISILDPVTGKEFEYKTTDGGTNFLFEIEFETSTAGAYLTKQQSVYKNPAGIPIVNGSKIGFTKDSPTYFYLPQSQPQPFLVKWSESLRHLPNDVQGTLAVSVTSEWKNKTLSDWLFNIAAEGSFGDLTYKVNVDALKSGSDYYFKINNIPSLFLGTLSVVKGKWVKISQASTVKPESGAYSRGGDLMYIARQFPETENKYKENQEKLNNFLRRAFEIADELDLVYFKDKPKSELVGDQTLTKYSLSLKKEAILPFYQKLNDEVNNNSAYGDFRELVNDPGLVEYLKSAEFTQVFEYFDKNTQFAIWTDKNGFPAIIEESLRIIPPDTAIQLKENQVNVIFKLALSNINMPVDIKAPTDFVTIEKVSEDFEKNSNFNYEDL